jgi:hypothetical protein
MAAGQKYINLGTGNTRGIRGHMQGLSATFDESSTSPSPAGAFQPKFGVRISKFRISNSVGQPSF